MNTNQFISQILTDIKVKLTDEFDKNFTRKAFFNERWASTKTPNSRGSLMLRSGNLRRSIQSRVQGNSIIFTSSLPYADIHNNGGEIAVTEKMKKYFWAMHIQAKNARKPTEAEQYKALALMKVGTKIKIPKRQFIGHHEDVDGFIREIISHNLQEINEQLKLIRGK